MSSHTDTSGRVRTRQRAKRACEMCKVRKRKCDGHEPCTCCIRYEYQCSFKPSAREKMTVSKSSKLSCELDAQRLSDRAGANQAHMEANSGTAFPHLLGMKMNPQSAPKVHGFSWNLGPRDEPLEPSTNMTDLISREEMEALANHYLEKIHPVYGVVDSEDLRQRIEHRWHDLTVVASYEYGRSRVTPRGVSCKLPLPRKDDFTTDLINLYQISEGLDPDRDNKASAFEEALTRVEGLTLSHDALILSQSNLALTIYRRLRILSVNISNDVLARVMRFGNQGLEAATRLAEDRCPWWHVVNLPFQLICILLTIDTRESLSHIGSALCSFRAITRHYNTPTIHTALETIESLVCLFQTKKELDSIIPRDSLQQRDEGPTEPSSTTPQALDVTSWLGATENLSLPDNFD